MSNNANEYNPDHVSPPGVTLMEMINQDNEIAIELAKRVLALLMVGDIPIDLNLAIQIAKATKTNYQFWLNREQQYRDGLAKGLTKIL